MSKPFLIIGAHCEMNGIGNEGKIPWHIPKEMEHFQRMTTTAKFGCMNAVIMGRTTWDSLPEKAKPLKGRVNIVVTSKPFDHPGAGPVIDFDTAVKVCDRPEIDVVWVIGGENIYHQAIRHPLCNGLLVTSIEEYYPCDRSFPFIDTSTYKICKFEDIGVDMDALRIGLEDAKETRDSDDNPWKIVGYKRINREERDYLALVKEIIVNGILKDDRTGVGTRSLFGKTLRFSLRNDRFPLLTTKRVFFKGVAEELLWFLRGDTSATRLSQVGVRIWDKNGSREFLDSRGLKDRPEGDLGPVYGFQWRHFGAAYEGCDADYTGKGVDQIAEIVQTLKTDPNSRRIVLTAWNPIALPEMALPPCHMSAIFNVLGGELNCMMTQRSCDIGLGVPFNIASYALLTRIIAHMTGLRAGDLVMALGDTHVYLTHIDALSEQFKRTTRPFPLLTIEAPKNVKIEELTMDNFKLSGYRPHPNIPMEMAV